jgi:hypothetical protein
MNVGELIEELQKFPKDMLITANEYKPMDKVSLLGSVIESVYINSSQFNDYPDRLYIGHRPIVVQYNNED